MSSRKSRRGNFTKGRIWIVFIFLLLRAMDFLLYYSVHTMPNTSRLIGDIIAATLWSAVLLTLVWMRQNWARYAMGILLLLSVAVALITEAAYAEFLPGNMTLLMVTYTIGQLTAALILIFSPSIQKLTSHSYV